LSASVLLDVRVNSSHAETDVTNNAVEVRLRVMASASPSVPSP